MEKQYYFDKIKKLIKHSYPNNAFMINDLNTGASYECTKKSLQRLQKQGCIKRAVRGVYYIPKFSKKLNEYISPNYEDILSALARNYNWTILPSKQNVLNLIGLDTQVSNKISYITSGPNKTYNILGFKVHLYHSNDYFIFNCSKPTMLFVQAINGINIDKITDKDMAIINKYFNKQDKQTILNETKLYKPTFAKIAKRMIEGIN